MLLKNAFIGFLSFSILHAETLKECKSEEDKISGCVKRDYHSNGNLWEEIPYKNGKFEGILKAYCENRESLNIKPIKEFGANYAEHYHSDETAIQKLINEAEAQAFKESGAKGEYKGQVVGAFHRKELGDIDLVWGDSNFGLAHILQQRTKQWFSPARDGHQWLATRGGVCNCSATC